MGPEATAEFYLRIIRIFQKEYGFVNDYDYPDIYIYNLPLPEIIRDVDKKAVLDSLQKGIDKLERIGSDFIVCPCNSANTFFPSLSLKLPFLNIFDVTCSNIDSKKIGILGTNQTIKSSEFQKRLPSYEVPTFEQQEKITEIITNILSGKKSRSDREKLIDIINTFLKKGCDSVILGCTELPLILKQSDVKIKIYDTISLLAEASAEYSFSENIQKLYKKTYLGK